MKTHIVLDTTYTIDDDQKAFVGTLVECHEFVSQQDSFGYELVPMTEKELKAHNL